MKSFMVIMVIGLILVLIPLFRGMNMLLDDFQGFLTLTMTNPLFILGVVLILGSVSMILKSKK